MCKISHLPWSFCLLKEFIEPILFCFSSEFDSANGKSFPKLR